MLILDVLNLSQVALLSVVVSLWLYWLWSRKDLYRFSLKFPGYFGQPILGSLLRIKHMKNLLMAVRDIYADCKQHTICLWMGLVPVIFTAEPAIIEKVLLSPDMLNKAKWLYEPIYKKQAGLAYIPAEQWHYHRKLINPSFRHKVLISLFPVFNKATNLAISQMSSMVDNRPHAIMETIQNISLLTTIETTMGENFFGKREDLTEFTQKLQYLMKNIITEITLNVVNFGFLLKLNRKFWRYVSELKGAVGEVVDQKLQSPVEIVADDDAIIKKPNIFIDQAIQIYKHNKFSYNDVVNESIMIIEASHDTTGTTVFAVLTMLAMHPAIQERLFHEIESVFPDKDVDVSYEHLEQLPYLDMVLSETMRLVPAIPLIGRHVVKETALTKDLIVPKNMQILISIFHLHRRTDIWGDDAEQFNPDHFLPENLTKIHPYGYLPFSKGIRNCIGWRYALFAAKVLLAGLLRNYRFETDSKYENLEFVLQVSLRCKEDPLFTIHHR